jgi:hypothetical protein
MSIVALFLGARPNVPQAPGTRKLRGKPSQLTKSNFLE